MGKAAFSVLGTLKKQATHWHRKTLLMSSLKDPIAQQSQALSSHHTMDPVQLRYQLLMKGRTSLMDWKHRSAWQGTASSFALPVTLFWLLN